jgi:hypothetical protein
MTMTKFVLIIGLYNGTAPVVIPGHYQSREPCLRAGNQTCVQAEGHNADGSTQSICVKPKDIACVPGSD